MHVTCNLSSLKKAFHTVSPFSAARSPQAILQNVKLDCGEQSRMLATNNENSVELVVQGVEVHKPGSVLLPVANFGSILRESSGDSISIKTSGTTIEIACGKSRFKMPLADVAEFPASPRVDLAKYHEVDAALLCQCIERTEFATDSESTRYALGGILLEMVEDRIVAVGTDGRRLSKNQVAGVSVNDHRSEQAIIRAESLKLVARALTDNQGPVKVAIDHNGCDFVTENATFHTRLLEGRFPKWRDVFPPARDSVKVTIQNSDLHSALRQASIMTSKESRGIDFVFGPMKLELVTSTADVGQSTVEVAIDYLSTDVVRATLDFRFVADFLKVLEATDPIELDICDSEQAVILSLGEYRYVVMPLTRDKPA